MVEKLSKHQNGASHTICASVQGKSPNIVDNRPILNYQKGLSLVIHNSTMQCLSPIQRMVIAEGKETSDNLKYIIDTSNRKQLKIKNGESALTDKHFDSKGTETIGTTSYNIFVSKPFMREYKGRHVDEKGHSVEIYEKPNDCGMYANALATGKDTWESEMYPGEHLEGLRQAPVGYDPLSSKAEDSEKHFDMEVGDMYRISWDDQLKRREFPKAYFHAATVIAKDNTDYVTSEADASKDDMERPLFHMYGEQKTFYDTYRGDFTEGEGAEEKKPFLTKYTKQS